MSTCGISTDSAWFASRGPEVFRICLPSAILTKHFSTSKWINGVTEQYYSAKRKKVKIISLYEILKFNLCPSVTISLDTKEKASVEMRKIPLHLIIGQFSKCCIKKSGIALESCQRKNAQFLNNLDISFQLFHCKKLLSALCQPQIELSKVVFSQWGLKSSIASLKNGWTL